MAGLDPAIYVLLEAMQRRKTWIPGTRAALAKAGARHDGSDPDMQAATHPGQPRAARC
jgi:hypothetical protein